MTYSRRDGDPAVLSARDWLIAAGLTLFAGLFLLTYTMRGAIPMEDASMLLRYSLHFAQGHGIVWNVGEHPVEGATDFLYMLLIGLLARVFHVTVFVAGRSILAVSQLASVALLYLASRRLFGAPVLVAAFVAGYCALDTAYHFVDSMFFAPFFALVALLAWIAVQWMARKGVTLGRALTFSLLGLALGLVRPEGNFIALFMLAAALYLVPAQRMALLLSFAATFAVLGGTYFAWRWHYFGYPLPNPFYVKHEMNLYSGIIGGRLVLEFVLPLLPVLGLGFCSREGRRALVALAIVALPFTAMWVTMSLDNDGYARFQYVMMTVVLLSSAETLSLFLRSAGKIIASNSALRLGSVGLAAAGAAMAFFYILHLDRHVEVNPGAYALAMRLHTMAAHGDTMVTTEAGTLPLFSDWRTIDALGLNNEWIAHHGGEITPAYLDRYQPDFILYKATRLGPLPAMTPQQVAAHMADFGARQPVVANTLRDYALSHGYTLAAVYGAEYCNFHYMWVRNSSPDAAAILAAVRDYPYGWQGSGAPTFDFRNEDGHNTCP